MLWLSLGENCLADDILKRHGLKSFSTPYSHGRSNIDYALTLEESNYKDFLNTENVRYEYAWGTKVVRSTIANTAEEIFDSSVNNGFEFTHHDIISSKDSLDSYKRKVSRLKEIKGKDDIVFLYHHRANKNQDPLKLFNKINKFRAHYETHGKKCFVICFTQTMIENENHRRVEKQIINKRIFFCNFFTKYSWSGDDPKKLWARIDDDLISEMLLSAHDFVTGNTENHSNVPTNEITIGIPLRSSTTSQNWENVCLRLRNTLASIKNQKNSSIRTKIIIAGHEKPTLLDGTDYKDVEFIQADFPPPTTMSGFIEDKQKKKLIICNHIYNSWTDGDLFMFMDADDILHEYFFNSVIEKFISTEHQDLALMAGYTHDAARNKFAYINGIDRIFYETCGSCFVSKITKKELPSPNNQNCFMANLKDHTTFPKISGKYNRRVLKSYYPGVAYIMNHGSNDTTERHGEDHVTKFVDQYSINSDKHIEFLNGFNI